MADGDRRQSPNRMELTVQIELPERTVANARTRRVAEAFEMSDALRDVRDGGRRIVTLLEPTRLSLRAGDLIYLVGASGSGKSRLLAALARRWPRGRGRRRRVVTGCLGRPTDPSGRPRSAVLDQLARPVGPTLRLLCLAGLAEARLWLMPAGCLSAGQADRLALAKLYAEVERVVGGGALSRGARRWTSPHQSRAPTTPLPSKGEGGPTKSGRVRVATLNDALAEDSRPDAEDERARRKRRRARTPQETASQSADPRGTPVLLLIDEFASRLDRLTARILSANLRRWLDGTRGVAVVAASAHDDLVEALRPDWIWVKTAEADLRIERGRP